MRRGRVTVHQREGIDTASLLALLHTAMASGGEGAPPPAG